MEDAYVVGIAESTTSCPSDDNLALAVFAALDALADAGLSPGDVDGVLAYGLYGDLVPAEAVGYALGIDELRLALDFHLGGQAPAMLIGMAARLITTGAANVILVSRALRGRSGLRVGSVDTPRFGQGLRRAVGSAAFPITAAMWARAYLEATGLEESALGAAPIFAATQRWRGDEPSGESSSPVDFGARSISESMESYLESPYVASPLRVADCVSEVDGAAAVVVVSERLLPRAAMNAPILVRGSVWRSRQTDTDMASVLAYEDLSRNISWSIREALLAELQLDPASCDVLSIYDCFSSVLLQSVEGLGLAPFGGAPAYLLQRLGQPPECRPWINPGGGMLARGYLHGMNGLIDACRALRLLTGTEDFPAVSVVVSGGMSSGSAVVLSAQQGQFESRS